MTQEIMEYADKVPEAVRATMRATMVRWLDAARTHRQPGDGSMFILCQEQIDGGKWQSGWDVRVTLLHDERMFKNGPHVIVDAESRSDEPGLTDREVRGRMVAKVEYTKEDHVVLKRQVLADLIASRDRINEEIADAEKSLAACGYLSASRRARTGASKVYCLGVLPLN